VLEVIGADFAGALSTDRGSSYDARALSAIPQNKCTAHLLRNIRQAREGQSPQAQTVGWELIQLIRKANSLWRSLQQRKISREKFDQRARTLKEELSRALNPRRILRIRDPDNRRLLRELAWHHKRGSLLRFLDDPTIEPTNNRAERALRPAVIARKVSQCSKNHRGAHATAVITSILQTAAKSNMDLLETLRQALAGENPFATIPGR
jgi:transposase